MLYETLTYPTSVQKQRHPKVNGQQKVVKEGETIEQISSDLLQAVIAIVVGFSVGGVP